MAAQGENAPVIVRRRKVVGAAGHHGGAWKVAYADFVTAMMAFFMLLWLLNATTEKQRKGIADYFDPTIQIVRVSGGGSGAFNGDSIFAEDVLAKDGTGSMIRLPLPPDGKAADARLESAKAEVDRELEGAVFDEVRKLVGSGGESMVSELQQRHIITRQTDEGLIVELFDLPGEPLFAAGLATPTPLMQGLAQVLAEVFALTVNEVAANGHVRAEPIVRAIDGAWNLSTARADAARELLVAAGLEPSRVQRVTGYADRQPAAANPMAVRNNRLEIILLRERF